MNRQDVVKTINDLKNEAGHKKILEVYNAQDPLPRGYTVKSSDPWCAATVSAVFLMNGYDDISECGCPQMIEKAKAKGIWVEDDSFIPQPGDVVLYDWQDDGKGDNHGNPDHVGIVIKVDKNKIVVREGNKRGTLGNRDILVDGVTIRGYITPPYEEAVSEVKEEPLDEKPAVSPGQTTEAKEKQEKAQEKYIVGRVYTIVVSALNVRKGAGVNFGKVPFWELTPDGRRHAYRTGALRTGTRVTCTAVRKVGDSIWIKIPSGWICAINNGKTYVK
jgi:hypothetical protein